MLNFGLVGPGNLAQSLVPALQNHGKVLQVFSRDPLRAKKFAEKFGVPLHGADYSELSPFVDVLFLAIRDDALRAAAAALKSVIAGGDTIVVHCSGAAPLSELDDLGKRIGVFYPLQTFSSSRTVDFSRIPIFLEGDKSVLDVLLPLARSMSSEVFVADFSSRLKIHLGGVFVNNFVNYFVRCAETLASDLASDHKIYLPLLRETVDKLNCLSPTEAQTGPARRGDRETIVKHSTLLQKSDPELAEVYRILSRRIEALYRVHEGA
ncbi:MAG: DUF2520 domain-containing protein [Bacteroidia bacterium]|nr:DUF2520 domain-containing protein [Bacteroidia bacterium]MDW8335107.1 DUF2520 domain-containing protein [Bacteroidia bacterium]